MHVQTGYILCSHLLLIFVVVWFSIYVVVVVVVVVDYVHCTNMYALYSGSG